MVNINRYDEVVIFWMIYLNVFKLKRLKESNSLMKWIHMIADVDLMMEKNISAQNWNVSSVVTSNFIIIFSLCNTYYSL